MRFLKTKTIRNKILLVFSATFFGLLILLFFMNRVFMVDHFIQSNRRMMYAQTSRFIEAYRNGDPREASIELTKNTGGQLFLFNAELQPIGNNNTRQEALPYAITDSKMIYNQALKPGGYFAVMGGDEPTNQTLVYANVFGEAGWLLVITKAMGLLDEASRMFFSFMLISSAIVYSVGMLIIFLISGNLSRPVVEINRVTRKMANLEFDERLVVKGSDELAELTQSVNRMADALSRSILDLHQSNEKLAQELSKERSLEKMRRRFVSDVSHELKNPISVILGYADGLVQNVPKTDEAKREYYGIIADEANGMNELVKNLLSLSSYESGSFTLDKETFSLYELIQNAMERFRYISKEKNVHITLAVAPACELYADRLRINQIIGNLLGNAFKYVNAGGNISIAAEQADGKTRLTVRNTGPLIPQQALDLIWNSFYQVHTDTRGSGLGLAIVKSIAEMHGGSCRAYTEGAFNCFEVIL